MSSFAVQKWSYTRLINDLDVTDLVCASSIIDAHGLPETFPSIIIGEADTVPQIESSDRFSAVHMTLHCWQRELGLEGVKAIAEAVRRCLRCSEIWTIDGYKCLDVRFTGSRAMRDPDKISSHAVVTFSFVIEEVTA
ncbi:hypothetical protein FHS85_001959 [Rhodoligotrophos appendicifer]|uniref:DUF3168 domain-containing protein n=1 Tax=Rhodoligotrophos appendicifer TaxID=987056 RepID=UPI001185CBDD|nr:DUF3168 domain-containing protein [Rhodoligotrophos appendicifer]